MTALLAILLVASPLADTRGPTEATIPTTVQGEASPSIAPSSGWLPRDKLLHASSSACLTFGLTTLATLAGMEPDHALLLGAGLTFAVGLAIELFGNQDPLDLLADGGGIAAAVVTTKLLVWKVRF